MAKQKQKEYYLRFKKGNRTYYVDGRTYSKTGAFKFVSKKHVDKSKKSVVEYSVKEKRVKTPENVESKLIEKTADAFAQNAFVHSQIYSQSIKKTTDIQLSHKKKIAIKYGGKLHQIKTTSLDDLKSFYDLTDKIQSIYFELFKDLGLSPLIFVGYIEGKNGVVFDYDQIEFGHEEVIEEEFGDELKQFRSQLTKTMKKAL